MALKKITDTRGLAPSLLRIPNILRHAVHDFVRLWTATIQSSTAVNITLPMYLKEGTVYRGRT